MSFTSGTILKHVNDPHDYLPSNIKGLILVSEEGWQVDFTTMAPCQPFKFLLVFWIHLQAELKPRETAFEVYKLLLKGIIPRFGLPGSLQSDNGSSFTTQVTQALTSDLDIKYRLHSFWRPQVSGKVEGANQSLKTFAKLCQEIGSKWLTLLLIALMRLQATLRTTLNISPFKMTYGHSFLTADLLFNSDPQQLKHSINLNKFQQVLQEWGTKHTLPH